MTFEETYYDIIKQNENVEQDEKAAAKNVKNRLRKLLNLSDKIDKTHKSLSTQKDALDIKIKDCEKTTKLIAKSLSLGKYDVKSEQGKSPEVQAQRI